MTITNEDNMELMARYEDNHFDLAIVDPPYGIGADITQNINNINKRISNGGKWKKYKKTNWDSSPPTEKYFNELLRVSCNQIVWGGNYFFNLNLNCSPPHNSPLNAVVAVVQEQERDERSSRCRVSEVEEV